MVLIHQDGLVPALEEMAGSLSFDIDMRRVGAVYKMHDLAEIFSGVSRTR
jgi:hypothetical protein